MSDGLVDENLNKISEEILKKLNLYTILQVIWLIEMYYLGINSIYGILVKSNTAYQFKIPSLILKYNELVLKYFNEFSDFILFLSVALLICGFSIIFIRFIPKLSDYNLLYQYSGYGFTAGIWLLLIYATYKLYASISIFFLVTPILVLGITELFKRIDKKLRLGLTD